MVREKFHYRPPNVVIRNQITCINRAICGSIPREFDFYTEKDIFEREDVFENFGRRAAYEALTLIAIGK